MQNLGPAQVETLYKNIRKGDSLCDSVTVGSLWVSITATVKNMVRSEHSQKPWLTDGFFLPSLNTAEQQEAYTAHSP